MMLGICKYLIVITSVFSISAILLFHYFNKFVADVFQPSHILASILIFIIVQLFLDCINYTTSCITKDHKLSMITRDRIPIYLNLLRL